MKSIAINFTLTEGEYELLRLGKNEKPNPQRIKLQLLHEAARNLRNMSESVLQGARGERPMHPSEVERLRRDKEARKAQRKPKTPLLDSLTKHGLPRKPSACV